MPSQNNWDNTKTFGNETLDASEMNQIADNIEDLARPPLTSLHTASYTYDSSGATINNLGAAQSITVQYLAKILVFASVEVINSIRCQLLVSHNGAANDPLTKMHHIVGAAYTDKYAAFGARVFAVSAGTHTFQLKVQTNQNNASYDVELDLAHFQLTLLGV